MYELTKLGPAAFEHLVNQLALKVLGPGLSTFAPGPDGGRDGYFEGSAPYPSSSDNWSGVWYFQSKFHSAETSGDTQKWLLTSIEIELKAFVDPGRRRTWPDIWIVATNVDPSGTAETGTFDKAKALVRKYKPKLAAKFHIWNGKKVLDLLSQYQPVAEYFRHFLTPGHVMAEMLNAMHQSRASTERIIRHLIVQGFEDHQYTKLEQAGSSADTRPGIHKLFTDVPIRAHDINGMAMELLIAATAQPLRIPLECPRDGKWQQWALHPVRAGIWFLRGGPGRGKSTIGQYFSQIQRAAIALQPGTNLTLKPGLRERMDEVQVSAKRALYFPAVPRIPIQIDLKQYASWISTVLPGSPIGVLTFLSAGLSTALEQKVDVGLLISILAQRSWFIAFDGLDEVPQDTKDVIGSEIRHFVDNVMIEHRFDLFVLCTSRPQGYSGQFDGLAAATADLVDLTSEQALACARPVLEIDRTRRESEEAYEQLEGSSKSGAVKQLMVTPLQAHIMAVVVRDGDRAPERRWQLFTRFYQVIRRREANKKFPDHRMARLLREDERLLRSIHNRVGFALHAKAESGAGATASMTRAEFEILARAAVTKLQDEDIEETVQTLVQATTERLVLVSTPDNGSQIRFDIRQLQEFFAAEFLYESSNDVQLRERLNLVISDPHWREVSKFLVSALIEASRVIEVTLAAQALYLANDPARGRDAAVLDRLLARGAIITSALLAEGVLEQDKQVRQTLAGSLEPIYSSLASIGDLRTLASTGQRNSRAWLIDLLAEKIRERVPETAIGAAVVLGLMLKDEDLAKKEVVTFVERAPLNLAILFVGTVLGPRIQFTSLRTESHGQPSWLVALACSVYKRTISTAPLQKTHAFWSLDFVAHSFSESNGLQARNAGLLESDIWALKLRGGRGYRTDDFRSKSGRSVKNLREYIAAIAQYQSLPRQEIVAQEVRKGSLNALIARYVQQKTLESLKAICEYLPMLQASNQSWPQILPFILVPISSEIPLADELRRIQLFTEIEFEYEMASEELFALRMLHIGRSLEQSDSLPILAESRRLLRARRPRTYIRLVALTLLGASNRNAATRPLNGSRVQPDLLQELLECLQEDGCASAVLPYCGNLIAKFKAKEMEIRNQVEVALRNCNCSNAPWSSGEALDLDRSRVGGYRLSPALESATTLVSAELIGYFFVYNFSDDVHRGQASLASAQRLAREYHPDAKLLFDAASAAVKGYEALVMAFAFAIHPDSERAHSHSLLRAAFEDGEWPHNGAVLVIVAVANWLAITGNASDDADAALAGFLAIKIMNFSPLNAGLLSALLTWREKSAAPVTKGGFDKLWLLQ